MVRGLRELIRSRFGKRATRIGLVAALTVGGVGAGVFAATNAFADSCFTWNRNLSEGSSGDDVKQLQIRLSGYPGRGAVLGIDGAFGPATKAALIRFQQAYGLTANGVANAAVFNKLYALQDNDCTPIHFSYAELNDCNTSWAQGGIIYQGENDSPDKLVADILHAGAGISNEEAARFLAEEGPKVVKALLLDEMHVPFSTAEGELDLTQEGAHSVSRIIHAGDATGRAIETTLLNRVKAEPNTPP